MQTIFGPLQKNCRNKNVCVLDSFNIENSFYLKTIVTTIVFHF